MNRVDHYRWQCATIAKNQHPKRPKQASRRKAKAEVKREQETQSMDQERDVEGGLETTPEYRLAYRTVRLAQAEELEFEGIFLELN